MGSGLFKRSAMNDERALLSRAQEEEVLSAALFDDEAATGFDDGPGMKAPRRENLGGVFMVMTTA